MKLTKNGGGPAIWGGKMVEVMWSGEEEGRERGGAAIWRPPAVSGKGRTFKRYASICEKIDGCVRWGNRPGCALDGRRPLLLVYHKSVARASPFGRKKISKILCSYLLTFS